jgi:hypothetical protein
MKVLDVPNFLFGSMFFFHTKVDPFVKTKNKKVKLNGAGLNA